MFSKCTAVEIKRKVEGELRKAGFLANKQRRIVV